MNKFLEIHGRNISRNFQKIVWRIFQWKPLDEFSNDFLKNILKQLQRKIRKNLYFFIFLVHVLFGLHQHLQITITGEIYWESSEELLMESVVVISVRMGEESVEKFIKEFFQNILGNTSGEIPENTWKEYQQESLQNPLKDFPIKTLGWVSKSKIISKEFQNFTERILKGIFKKSGEI